MRRFIPFAAVLAIVPTSVALIESDDLNTVVTMLVGWLLIFCGIARLTRTLKASGASQTISQALIGIACMIAGLYCLTHPVPPISTLAFPCRKCMAWTQARTSDLARTSPD